VKEGALRIVQTLKDAGYQALLAGGCVRDMVLGTEPADWDVATDADPQAVMQLFARTVPVGLQFGIVVVVLDEGEYEVARFRRDGHYLDGRHPQEVEFSSAEEDAQRRDFTINGMFYDPFEERIIDYVGGQDDIEQRVVRAIGDASQRFGEDYLRMLRAVRFAARLDFAIAAQTRQAIAAGAGNIGQISAERIRDELTKMLIEGRAATAMQLLLELGLLAEVLPEVVALDGVPQPPEFHPEGDVWTHVKILLDGLQESSATLAWAVLLHDIGKPSTYEVADRIRFNRHDAVGAAMAAKVCRRLRMSNAETETISTLTAQHMRFRNVKDMRASKLKRFLRQPDFAELLELHRLDCLASHGELDLYEFCREKMAEAEPEDLRPPRLLSGRDLIAMGFKPGVLFKEILTALEDEQLEGRLNIREEAVAWVQKQYGDALRRVLS
jgi:poly(A) polymerase